MNHIHAISIYACLGYDSFAMMLKSIFEQEVGEDSTEEFLLKLRLARTQDHDLECKQKNQAEHHQLQKLVDNGKQLDHAVESG
jgi:hypothetical protein